MEEILQPIYRIEDYWYAIVNGLSCPHTPIYRIEQYLAYLCGADVEVPQPIYRIEQYLAYKCGLDVELPTPIYRDEMFLAKWCGMDVEPPTPIYRIEVLLSQLSNGELKTVTGNPISISDALARPAESLVADINAVQDLHGYANPWPAGGGKNILPTAGLTHGLPSSTVFSNATLRTFTIGTYVTGLTHSNYYQNLVTNVEVADNLIKFTTQASAYGVSIPLVGLEVGSKYTISATTTKGIVGLSFYQQDGTFISGSNAGATVKSPYTATVPANTYYTLVLFQATENDAEITFSNIQLEKNASATSFAPYSNICPITGFTGVNIWRTGKNLLDPDKMVTYGNGNGRRWYYDDGIILKAGQTYTLSVSGSDQIIRMYFIDKAAATSIIDATGSVSYTPSEDTLVYLQAYRGTEILDTNRFQLELGSTATAYEPYAGTTYSIDWTDEAGTVYGGTLDVTTGVLTVDRAEVDFGTLTWNYHTTYAFFSSSSLIDRKNGVTNIVSDLFKTEAGSWSGTPKENALWGNGSNSTIYVQFPITDVSEFLSLISGHQLVYELATPITYQLTPTQVDMLLGNNVIWNDVGDMTLEYLADGPADDVDALQILLNNRYVNNGAEDEATDKEALEILLGGNTR